MFVDYEYNAGKLIVSYIDGTGKLKHKNYSWPVPRGYEVCDENDPQRDPVFKTWDGNHVKFVPKKYPDRYAVYEFLDALPEEDQKEIFDFNSPDIYFMDIETEVIDEFPDPVAAKTRVLANAIVNGDKVLLMGLKPLSEKQVKNIEKGINNYFSKFNTSYVVRYVKFDDEYELLHTLFYKLIPKMPVITGWNFEEYDWVYLVNRCRKNGLRPEVASPTGRLIKPWSKNAVRPKEQELPLHRVIVDYMDLYKKWDTAIKIKESDRLDFVAEKLLELKKIEYDGTLQDLYEADFEKYMLYNAVDTLLVKHIHEKMRYVDIMYAISVLSRVRMTDAFSSIRVTEGILRGPLRKEQNIVMFKQKKYDEDGGDYASDGDDSGTELELKGGYVKEPITGMSLWTVVFDFASLYPTVMRQFNIAPESYKGQKISESKCIYHGKVRQIEPDDIILLNDAVFSAKDSSTKQVLTDIYYARKTYKKKMNNAKDEIKKLEKQL